LEQFTGVDTQFDSQNDLTIDLFSNDGFIPFDIPQISFTPAPTGPIPLKDRVGRAVSRVMPYQCRASIRDAVDGEFSVFKGFNERIGTQSGRLIIVAGGPSIQESLPHIRKRLRTSKNTKILALNKSHDWLLKKGIKPDFAAMCDPAEWLIDYMTPTKGVEYWLASQLNPEVLRKFMPFRKSTYIWHVDNAHDCYGETDSTWATREFPGKDVSFLGFGSTIGMAMMLVSAVAGFDEVELHGYDSCFHPGNRNLHAYPKPRTEPTATDTTVKSVRTGKSFRFSSNIDMAMQCLDFDRAMTEFPHTQLLGRPWKTKYIMHGRGVLPWLVSQDGGGFFKPADPDLMAEYNEDMNDYRPDWARN